MRIAALLLTLSCCLSAATSTVAGKWQLTAKDPYDTTVKAELVLQQNGGELSGSVKSPEGTAPLREVSFKDNVLVCTLPYEDTDVKLTMKLEGDTLKGQYEADGGPTGPVEAVRASQAPAGLAGTWNVMTTGPDGDSIKLQLTMKQDGNTWKGNMVSDSPELDLDLEGVKVEGTTLSFQVPTQAGTYSVKATVSGNRIEGISTAPDGSNSPISGSR